MIGHLFACTIGALIAAGLVFLLRRRSAGLRHSILFASLLAFAVPTPLLTKAADKLLACFAVRPPSAPALPWPFPVTPSGAALSTVSLNLRPEWRLLPDLLWLAWAIVFGASLGLWLRRVLRPVESIRPPIPTETEGLERAKRDILLSRDVALCIAPPDRVPGARGFFRSCVILPDGLSDRLRPPELQAILTHELTHIARRDNLWAAIARVIVSAFWFHPLLWWIERRMLAEREAACDERVLAQGADPADYVSAILKVCRMPFAGADGYAGATGANLKRRMEQIMFAHKVRPTSRFLRAMPGLILALGVAGSYVRAQVPAQPANHPANDSMLQRAKDCFDQGRFTEAEALFRQVYVKDPADPRGLTGLVETYFSEMRSGDAIQLIQSEIGKNPGRRDLQIALANLYVRTSQYDRAIAELRALLNSPVDVKEAASLHFRLGETYRRKGEMEAAMREFAESSAADPGNTQALLQLALIFDGTGERPEAGALYEKILQMQPDHPVALNNLAYLRADSGMDLDQSLAMALKAHQKAPDSSNIDDTVGWIYVKMNRPGDAEASFRDALKLEPDSASIHYHLGVALMQEGQQPAAIEQFQTALAKGINQADAAQIQSFLSKLPR